VIVIGHGRVLADSTFDTLRETVLSDSDVEEPSIEQVISRFYDLHGAIEA
jgi:ABC-type uncharacterized transport system ATPase subunit